jgi:hypothetical protein
MESLEKSANRIYYALLERATTGCSFAALRAGIIEKRSPAPMATPNAAGKAHKGR